MSSQDSQDRSAPGMPKGSVVITRMPRPDAQSKREPKPVTGVESAELCLVVDGYDVVLHYEREHNTALKAWHENLKNSDFPYKLKPTHTVTKGGKTYRYPGTYWLRFNPESGVKGKWDYVGRDIPDDVDMSKIPAPPVNRLDGFQCERVGRGKDILVTKSVLRQFRRFFDGYHVFNVTRSEV